jgi:hypothetical protein
MPGSHLEETDADNILPGIPYPFRYFRLGG